MIITANSTPHTVDIRESFTPIFKRAIKFITSLNGKYQPSDRGAVSDKYECVFTVIGDIADINDLVDDLYLNSGQLTIDTQGGKIFGTGVDHSGTFTCNLLNKPKYPIRDLRTATVQLKVRVVSPIVYDSGIPATLPTLFYQWPVNREINVQKSPFDAIEVGDFGNVTRVDSLGVAIKSEVANVKFKQKDDEFGRLHRFVAATRGDSFLLNTETCLELFLNSTSESVKIIDFKYKPDGIKYWDVTMKLVNNV